MSPALKRAFLSLLLIALAPPAFGQGEAQNSLGGSNAKRRESVRGQPSGIFNTLYGFLARTLNNESIASRMRDLYEDDVDLLVANKRDYGYLLPDVEMTPVNDKKITDTSRSEVQNAASKESIKSVPYLAEMTKSFSFSLDLAAPFGGSNKVEQKKPTSVDRSVHRSQKQLYAGAFSNTAGLLPLYASTNDFEAFASSDAFREIAAEQHETRFDWGRYTRFKGSISHGLEKSAFDSISNEGVGRFSLNLKQESNHYEFMTPLGLGASDPHEGRHKFRMPLYRTLTLGHNVDLQGKAVASSLERILFEPHRPQFDLLYYHQENVFAGECMVNSGSHRLQMNAAVPLNDSELDADDFRSGTKTKYEMAYRYSF